eukprot:GHVT01038672.1.p5 GENE.GHVT01038672.1~~GHVT01038672.1.p5  ORF type:complete len:110 (+),score=18.00 GHVT01038672.1:1045-1374(+)
MDAAPPDDGGSSPEEFKMWMNARVLWPPSMPEGMLAFAIQTAQDLLLQHNPEKDGEAIAKALKVTFDSKYSPNWHVTVGKKFGCYSVHETDRLAHFYLNKIAFLMYKSG